MQNGSPARSIASITPSSERAQTRSSGPGSDTDW
jgi:hypothetical protein